LAWWVTPGLPPGCAACPGLAAPSLPACTGAAWHRMALHGAAWRAHARAYRRVSLYRRVSRPCARMHDGPTAGAGRCELREGARLLQGRPQAPLLPGGAPGRGPEAVRRVRRVRHGSGGHTAESVWVCVCERERERERESVCESACASLVCTRSTARSSAQIAEALKRVPWRHVCARVASYDHTIIRSYAIRHTPYYIRSSLTPTIRHAPYDAFLFCLKQSP
jgi:hypothetical protein